MTEHSEASAMSAEEQERVEQERQEEAAGNGGAPSSPSVLDAIKSRRAQLAEEKTIELLVPGYEGNVAVRYRAEPIEELREEFRKAERRRETDPLAGVDILIRLCETILVRDQETDKLMPLAELATRDGRLDEPHPEDNPVQFDERLAQLLGFAETASSARQIVKQLFSPEEAQVLAPASHIQSLQQWLQGQAEQIDNTLLDF